MRAEQGNTRAHCTKCEILSFKFGGFSCDCKVRWEVLYSWREFVKERGKKIVTLVFTRIFSRSNLLYENAVQLRYTDRKGSMN